MQRLSLLAVLFFAAAPVLGQGDPPLSPPSVLAGDLTPGPAGGEQQDPAIAAGAGMHLAAWADHRSAFTSTLVGDGTRDVYGQLIGADGAPLALSFRIAGGLGHKKDVQVAWNGTHWLVTWVNVIPTTFFKAVAVFGARVAPSGQVLDDPPISIRAFDGGSHIEYALGSDGIGWGLAIQDQSGPVHIEGWYVHSSGLPQLMNPAIFTRAFVLGDFQLSWSGSQYLLKWEDSGTRALRTSATFDVLGPEIAITPNSSAGLASITSDGDGWMAAYSASPGFGVELRYRGVSATGSVGPVTTVTSGTEPDNEPRIMWNGNGYHLVWWRGLFQPTVLRYARIDASGTLLDPDGVAFESFGAPSSHELSSLGDGNVQAVWVDKVTTPPHTGDISGARLTPAGADTSVSVGTSAPRQGFYDLAVGPEGYMAVFTSERNDSISIVAQRLDEDGQAIDPEPIELGAKDTYGHPSVAWNGEHWLVVWHDRMVISFVTDDVVLGRRIAADGTLIDGAPFSVLEGADPDVDAVGDTFLVAARFASSTQIFYINGVRVDATGTVLDSPPLFIGTNHARFPSVGSFGDRWVVAWQRNPSHDNPSASANARVVFPGGGLTPIVSLGGGSGPVAAASQDTALVAWGGANVTLRRLDSQGNPIGGSFAASSAPEAQGAPSLAWNGTEFLVAWRDYRNIGAFFDDRGDIYATRVSEGGSVLDPGGLAIAVTPDDEQQPAVVGREGTALVAYGASAPSPWQNVRTTVVKVGDGACQGQDYCTTSPNSAGSGATIGFSGSTSVSTNDLVLNCSGAVTGQAGIFFYGTDKVTLPFGDGTRCVGGQTFRFPPQFVGAGGNVLKAVDLTNPPQPAGQITAGSTWFFQFWYRDPAAGGGGFNLSNGLSVSFCD